MRTMLFAAYLGALTVAVTITLFPLLVFGQDGARTVIKLWSRSALAGLSAICGVRHIVLGAENLPRGGAIIASNHQSMWETIALVALAPKPVLLFKRELLKVPFYSWWGLLSGSIPVDRNAGPKAIREITRAATARVKDGCQVIVFPEGTRARVAETLPLQPGVVAIYLSARAPCTPAVHDSGRFWLYPGGLTSPKRKGVITLKLFPPIEPGLNRKTFEGRLEAALAQRTALQPMIEKAEPATAGETEGRPA